MHHAGVAGAVETRTMDEIAAIASYTCENYYGCLNKALREVNREAVVPHVEFIWLFMHALRKCSKYTGHMVYRGKKGEYISSSKINFGVSRRFLILYFKSMN